MLTERIIHHKIGEMRVTYTPESKKLLALHTKRLRNLFPREKYSFLHDIITTSSKMRKKRTNGSNLIILPSQPVQEVKGVKCGRSSSKLYGPSGKLETIYYTKKTTLKAVPTLFIKDTRDKKSIPIKKREPLDVIKQEHIAGIKHPKFLIQIELPIRKGSNKTRLVTVTQKLENAMSIDRLFVSGKLIEKEKINLLKRINRDYIRLIKADLVPSITRAGHILVTLAKPRTLYYTDTGAGFSDITRNKLALLEELATNPSIRRPDWDAITASRKKFENYYFSLPKKIRMSIQKRKVEQLLEDIKTPPERRVGLPELIKRTNKLIKLLFPESHFS